MAVDIVVVGAGYSGVLTAKKLAKKFKKRSDVQITIIDKNPYHTMLTELHEVAAQRVEEDSIRISLKKIFAGRRVNVSIDTITHVDRESKTVVGQNAKYHYDYLVMAAGSKPTFFGVPGAEEYSYKLWSYDDAIKLREHLHNKFRQASCETDAAKRKQMLNFVVVGAGFTGVEMIGELAELAPSMCSRYELNPKDISMSVIDVLPRIMPIIPEKLTDKVVRRLGKMGVKIMTSTNVVAIGEDYIEVRSGSKDAQTQRFKTETVIWAAGIQSSDITADAAQQVKSQRNGRLDTDEFLRSVDDERIYVAGDNLFFVPKGEERPVPQMVENCEQSADVIAHNIHADITKHGTMVAYKPQFHGVMVSVGGRYATAHVGLPGKFFGLPSFLAMFAKHFINIIYFLQVLGWNKVFSYLKHEIFTIRNRRSFVGGHFSNRTPSFLIVPLRLWLGAVWLFEGIKKIVEGWLVEPKLTGFFGGANAWYNSILSQYYSKASMFITASADATSAATAATDATSAATGEAAASVGEMILNFNVFGLVNVLFVSGKEVAKATIEDFAFRLDIPVMNWFINTFVLPNDTMQRFMQGFIVISEIVIGLALIGGLFTFLAAAFSLVLQFMFVSTTGLYLSTFWMVFGAVVVLIGGGHIFGLDCYVIPWLKAKWKNTKFARKTYIYND